MTTSLEAIRTAIKDVLVNNLTDPLGRSNSAWITGEAPESYENTNDFPGWPFITVGHPNTDEHTKAFGTGTSARRMRPVAVILMVHARGGIEIEQLVDNIETAIYGNEATLISSGLNGIDVVVGEGDLLDVAENIHVIPVTVDVMA